MKTINRKFKYFKDFPWANESKWIWFFSFCMQLLYNLTFCQAAAEHWEPGKSPFWMLLTLAILVASPLLFPLWMWNLNLWGNIFIGLFRGIIEGVGEFVHCIKGDMTINNPDSEYFIKKLSRIELPGEPRIEPEVKLVEIPVPFEKIVEVEKVVEQKVYVPLTHHETDDVDEGIRIYLESILCHFMIASEVETFVEDVLLMRHSIDFDESLSKLKPVTSASVLIMMQNGGKLQKNDIYTLVFNTRVMMRLGTNNHALMEVYKVMLPGILGNVKFETFGSSVTKMNRMDRTTGKILANKVVQQFTKEQIDNFDLYVTGKLP